MILINWTIMAELTMKKTKTEIQKYADTKHCKMLYHEYDSIIGILFIAECILSILSCDNSIDSKIRNCFNSNDTIINLYDLYPEEWDTVYFFNASSTEDIEKRIGPIINDLWVDSGDKMLILNKYRKVVYYKEWDMYYGQNLDGILFRFEKDSPIIAIARKDAKFLIRKRDKNSFWVIHQKE